MSVRKLTTKLLATLALCSGVGLATGLSPFPGMGESITMAGDGSNLPPADPFAFDPDFRWFEPIYDADLIDLKPEKRAPTGWFATYDRQHLFASRPELDTSNFNESGLDSGWGHRYEIGYMRPGEDNGWQFTFTEADVYELDVVNNEALNLFESDGDGGSITTNTLGFLVPPGRANNLGFGYRFYPNAETINVVEYDAYELNKTWRLKPYHYGGILEPLVGARWMRVEDINGQVTVDSSLDSLFTDPTVPPGGIPTLLPTQERITSFGSYTEQELITGQVGFRYFKSAGRFTYSTDFRVFAGGNFQNSRFETREIGVFYDTDVTATDLVITVDEPPISIRENLDFRAIREERNEEFVIGFDIRGDVSYQLTKMFSIRAGVQLIDIGTGVFRGGIDANGRPVGDPDQDLLLVGGSLGISLNH